LATLSQLHNILAVQRQQQPQDSSSTYIALTTLHPVPWRDRAIKLYGSHSCTFNCIINCVAKPLSDLMTAY